MVRRHAVRWSCAILFSIVPLFISGGSAWTKTGDEATAKFAEPGGYEEFVAKTEKTGTIRTLVRVRTSVPDTTLSETDVLSRRAAVSTAQRSLIRELEADGIDTTGFYSYKYIPYILMKTNKATLATLAASSRVVSIEEDMPVPAGVTAGWDTLQTGATALHAAGHTGAGAYVAVLDTGVDKYHPYLAGAVVSESCYSTTDAGYGSLSLCPDGATESTAIDSALPYGTGVCPTNKCDHGTHVAGTAAGRQDIAGSPGPGMAPGAGVIAIQVFSRFDSETYCNGDPSCALSWRSDQIKGLERVFDLKSTYRIAAVNMSLGGGRYSNTARCNRASASTKAVIDLLREAGIATVVASGNSGYCHALSSPACISTAVSVGATDSNNDVAYYSNSASFLNLLAPGSEITSSIPGDAYASWNGTSMAAPHVAGAWALIVADRPSTTVSDVLHGLTATGVSVQDRGKCPSVTKKRINVYNAYYRLIPPPAISVSPGAVSFGNVKEGVVSVAKTVTVKNTGPNHCSLLNINSISLNPPNEFILNSASCPPIERGKSCTFTVQLNASAFGLRTAYLTIESNASNKPAATVKLTGNAKPPVASVSSSAVDFRTVLTGNVAEKRIPIRNTGLSDLLITGIASGGDPSFTIDTGACSGRLNASQSCTLPVRFAPVSAGSFAGTITITSNDPAEGRSLIAITLKGRGNQGS